MTDDRNERALFAFQTLVLLSEEVGGIDQPPAVLRKLAEKTVAICNDQALFRVEPIDHAELMAALRAGPMLVTRKAQELRRAASRWEAEFPSPRVLGRVIGRLEAGR